MGYTFSFVDDTTYSATDINNITKRFVSSGIEDSFANGVSYNTGRLNIISNNLVEKGVVPESNDTLRVTKMESSRIKILSGTAFMDNGSTFTVDDDGVILDYIAGETNYVFIEDNNTLNVIRPVVSSTLPSTYDYVLLAIIDSDEIITDKRTFAIGKVPGYMSDFNQPTRTVLLIEDDGDYEVDLGRSVYNCIMLTEYYGTKTNYNFRSFSVWNKYDETYITASSRSGLNFYDDYFFINPQLSGSSFKLKGTISMEGTLLKLHLEKTGSSSPSLSCLEITAF